MKNASTIEAEYQDTSNRRITAMENERKKLREETLTWISDYALSRVQLVWRGQSSTSTLVDSAT